MHPATVVASILLSAAFVPTLPKAQPERNTPATQPTAPPAPNDPKSGSSGAPNPSSVDAACALRQDMRKLWTDHTVWTRDYIIAAVDDKPDQQSAASRLMKNQEDIGAAIATYYGKNNGDRLTALLKEHITLAGDVIKAAKTKDASQFKAVDEQWKRNADEIADFLNSANPNWTRASLTEMMMMHLSTTTEEVKARLDKDWDRDVKAYDKVYEHILKMSDALADGIVRQFPERFAPGTPKSK